LSRSTLTSPERLTRREDSRDSTSIITLSVFILSVMFFVTGVSIGILYRRLGADPIWILLMVPFSFGMTGALVLFHFLHSSARLSNSIYSIGGAAAGFIILFGTFYHVTKEPFLDEMEWYKIHNNSLSPKIVSLLYAFNKIQNLHNDTINKIAYSGVDSLNKNFWQWSTGTYEIDANELWLYLKPLIQNAKSTYYATQYVLPETFWNQYWSEAYFKLNIQAVRNRNIDLVRIFIVNSKGSQSEQRTLDDLIMKHVENGINIRIIDEATYNYDTADLRDILIVDNQLAGVLKLEKGGRFNKVEFSVDPEVVEQRRRNFERLRDTSMTYDEWRGEAGRRDR
jgi:hypothetical protein